MPNTNEFDYIIIGGGSAGCVVASRLSENKDAKICLIEAGPSNWNPLYRVPMLAGRLYRAKLNNWFYFTEPQQHLNQRKIFWPRGRMLGGSFIFNGMVYIRGNAADYDRWSNEGNIGWSFSDVLPVFKKSENFCEGANLFHGENGPLPVNKARKFYPIFDHFVNAALQAGHTLNHDFNGTNQDGVGFYHFNIASGSRQTTADTFLRNSRASSNLRILTKRLVAKLLIKNGRATGVLVENNGRLETLFARNEIILTAGALNTPQLLLLSGIGPADHLCSKGIKVIHELKGVGENLQDHLDVALAFKAKKPVSMIDNLRLDNFILNLGKAAFGLGPSCASPIEAGGFFKSRSDCKEPDLQAFVLPIAATNASIWNPFSSRPSDTFAVRIGQVKPLSRGTVRLRSDNPLDHPVLQPNYLSEPADLEAQIAGVHIVREIINQKAFQQIVSEEIEPGLDATNKRSITDWIRNIASSAYHPVGTARMGVDELAVVDHQLKVRGLEGLRIADASVMPDIIAGNTNAPTIMIAERAAEFIIGNN